MPILTATKNTVESELENNGINDTMNAILLLVALTASCFAESTTSEFCTYADNLIAHLSSCKDTDSCLDACEEISDDYPMRRIANSAAFTLFQAPLFEYCDSIELHTPSIYQDLRAHFSEKQAECPTETKAKKSRRAKWKKFNKAHIRTEAQR